MSDLSLTTVEGRVAALEVAYEVANDKGDAASMVKAVAEAQKIFEATPVEGRGNEPIKWPAGGG